MKISINKIKLVPPSVKNGFEFCVFGEPDDEVRQWIYCHLFETYQSGHYTNIRVLEGTKLSEIFEEKSPFAYLDGFSPNLNKKLHIGHFSNLVLAKAFVSLGICEKTVSIYGDTLEGEISNETGFVLLLRYLNQFAFHPDKFFYASDMEYKGDKLKDGTEKYAGTKIFEAGDNKVVAIKNTGETTYFYQDVALAELLNSPTLYLTGREQSNHFSILKKMFPHIEHIGLGLVKVSGKKMASRVGNVILIDDFIDQIREEFHSDINLIYNIFAGYVLKSTPQSDKNINMDVIGNSKNSEGLYLSYTMARMKSAGLEFIVAKKPDLDIEFAYLKSKFNYTPNVLFDVLVERCKKMNSLYKDAIIKDNPENAQLFQELLSQLLWGCEKLGLFFIEKV